MQAILNFWRDSYKSNPIAFYFELISFLLVVSASMTLAVTARSPDMSIIYPLFLLSSLTALVAHLRRKLAFPLLASVYFSCVNVLGFSKAVGLL